MQLMRNLTNILRQLHDPRLKIAERLPSSHPSSEAVPEQAAGIEGEQCQFLAQVVMKLARNPFSLLFFGVDQTASQGPQFLPALLKRAFRLPAFSDVDADSAPADRRRRGSRRCERRCRASRSLRRF